MEVPGDVAGQRVREAPVFGPLPRLYRLVIVAVVLAHFVGLGVWMGFDPRVPVLVGSGAALGVAVGMLMAWLLVHEPHQPHQARAVRQRRR